MPHTGGGPLPSPIDYDHHFTARFTMTPAGHCFPLRGGHHYHRGFYNRQRNQGGLLAPFRDASSFPNRQSVQGGQLAHFGDASALPRNARKSKMGGCWLTSVMPPPLRNPARTPAESPECHRHHHDNIIMTRRTKTCALGG